MTTTLDIVVQSNGTPHVGRCSLDVDSVTVSFKGSHKSAPLNRCRPEVVAKAVLLRLVRDHLKAVSGSALPEMHDTITYDKWLLLTSRERDLLSRTWITNFGENIHIPKEAGRRFMQGSPLPIVTVRVGIYHMGVYILNPELWPKDYDRAPAWFEQEFDGFRIGFCKHDPTIKWEVQ